MLFPPLDKRNPRDKAKDLCISSERYIVELGVRSPWLVVHLIEVLREVR